MALVTGNTLILKPSERDPGAAMMIAELCERAGLPAGVLNIVHGSVPTVNAICDHPKIKAISFVGGDRAGRHIYERYVSSLPIAFGSQLTIVSNSAARRTANVFRCASVPVMAQTPLTQLAGQHGCQEPRRCHARW